MLKSANFAFILLIFICFPLELSFSWEIISHPFFLLLCQIISPIFLLNDTISLLKSQKISNPHKICTFLCDSATLIPFFLPEQEFCKLIFLVLKFGSFFNFFDHFLLKVSFRISVFLKLFCQMLLLFHFISNSWLCLLRFEAQTDDSWFHSLQLYDKNTIVAYIYSIKWTFHIFFPLVSTPFNPNNELEALFEIFSIVFISFFYLFNIDTFIFLFHDFVKSYEKLEKVEYFSNIITDIEKNAKKKKSSIMKVGNEIYRKNQRDELRRNVLLEEVREEFYEEFIRNLVCPIILEKFPFLYNNFSKDFLMKVVKICKLKRFNEGDMLIEVDSYEF